MSSVGYFQAFPTITYQNTNCVDISRRTKVLNSVLHNVYAFYPYTVQNGQRVDVIANKYYDDPFYSWLLYLSNQIIDPYYDWYMSYDELNDFLISKYGSLLDSYNRISFWRNNYYNDPTIMTQSGYNALPYYLKRYWTPVYYPKQTTYNYKRTQEDWTMNINQAKSLQFSGNTNFQANDLIIFNLAGSQIGSGQITKIQNNVIYYNQVQGYTDNYLMFSTNNASSNLQLNESVSLFASNSYNITNGVLISLGTNNNTAMVQVNSSINTASIAYFKGNVSNGHANVIPILTLQSYISGYNNQTNLQYISTTLIVTNIPLDEQAYYSPVTNFDLANEKNTFNQTIRILDKSYATIAVSQLKKDLNS